MIDSRRKLAAVLLAAATLGVAGCGSDDSEGEKLPPRIQGALDPRLDSIADRVADGSAGACDDIYASPDDGGDLAPIDAALEGIPDRVDPAIRAALEESIDRLKALVDRRCEEIRGAAEEDVDTAPADIDPEPVDTETDVEPPPETAPTTPETTPTTPDGPATPGGDGGNGNDGPGQGQGDSQGQGEGQNQGQGQGPTGQGPPGQGGGLEAPEE